MKNVDQAPQAPIDFEKTSENVAGVSLTIAGIAFTGWGLHGIDTHEAATPQDALASTYVGDSDIFITKDDLGYGALMGVVLAIGVVGVYKLFGGSRKHSSTTSNKRSVSPDSQEHIYHKVHQPSE